MTAATHPSSPSLTHHPEKAITLALTLAQAERAIHEFTSNQVDAIVDIDGKAYLLRPAQEQLRQRERRLQAIIDSVADVITLVNREGAILSQSHAVSRVLGYAPEELVGSSFFDLIHEEDVPAVHFAFFNVIEGFHENATVEFLHLASDGSYRVIGATVGKLRDGSMECAIFSLRPITGALRVRKEKVLPGATGMPSAEEREFITLSHGRQIPLIGTPPHMDANESTSG